MYSKVERVLQKAPWTVHSDSTINLIIFLSFPASYFLPRTSHRGTSWAGQWFRLRAPAVGAWARSPLWALQPCIHSATKKKKCRALFHLGFPNKCQSIPRRQDSVLSLPRAQVLSLVGELRCSRKPKEQQQQKPQTNKTLTA